MKTEKIIKRVRKLMDKAESTDHEAERESLIEKANALMEEYTISITQVEMAGDAEVREPVAVFVPVGRSVGKPAKGTLAVQIAKANRAQVVGARRWDDDSWKSTDGFEFHAMPEDAEWCAMLFTSLEVQAETAYDPKLKPSWVHGRTYRASFMEGFYARVGDRIAVAARKRAAERDEESSTGTDLVLMDIEKRIQQKFGKAKYGKRRTNYDSTGYADGGKAGNSADLSAGRTRQMGRNKELTR